MNGGGQCRGATSAGGHTGRDPFDGQAALFNRGRGRGRGPDERTAGRVGVGGRVPAVPGVAVRPPALARSRRVFQSGYHLSGALFRVRPPSSRAPGRVREPGRRGQWPCSRRGRADRPRACAAAPEPAARVGDRNQRQLRHQASPHQSSTLMRGENRIRPCAVRARGREGGMDGFRGVGWGVVVAKLFRPFLPCLANGPATL